ncbi:cadmium transporter [Bifidobacterium sp. MA2]|uniref:Cadmium transporter n=1 Tax=Bifidobacterium santillanense TaxID=2809028 RepID=A0ABS5UQ59_9BIFI|nr:cadmium transporter [Bifidobacterium santillanense]MBT1172960.1 cadmium transporter [Bifidobacterium santillanense]
MPSSWTDVEKDTADGLPTMLAQNVIIGTALSVGAIACSGFYLSMIGNVASLVPWALMVVLVAVAFTYVVGFALLWCVESFTLRMRERFRPVAYGVVGAIGYGVWGLFVMSSLMNSLDQPLNGVVLSNGEIAALTVNYAVFGFVAYLLGQTYAKRLAARRGLAIGLLAAQIVLAVLGLVVGVMMFSALGR